MLNLLLGEEMQEIRLEKIYENGREGNRAMPAVVGSSIRGCASHGRQGVPVSRPIEHSAAKQWWWRSTKAPQLRREGTLREEPGLSPNALFECNRRPIRACLSGECFRIACFGMGRYWYRDKTIIYLGIMPIISTITVK